MRLVDFSVKNYQFTIIIFIMIMAIGVSSLLNMPKAEDPALKATFNSIVVVYPGTSPADMEKLIVDPIEDKMSEISDIKKVISTADEGVAQIRLEFVHSIDSEEKYNEVVRELNAIRSKLPSDIYSMDVLRFTPEGVNIIQCAVMSETAQYKDLEKEAERLKDNLLKVKSIKTAEIWAFPKQQITISVNLDKMAQFRIPLNRVLGSIQSENANIPAGNIEIGSRKFSVKTSGSYENIEEIKNTIVSSSGTTVTYLRDVADVKFDYEEETYLGRLNGKRAVFVTATMKDGSNIFTTGDQIRPIIDDFAKSLPADMRFEQSFDQVKSVSHRLFGLARDFGIAILLVLITLIPLGIRPAIIVMISIPLSLAMGLTMLDLAGFGINQLSVVGLVIALGLLVDDSIVVVENIARFLRTGMPRQQAAIEATKQISLAVLGCTATLIFAFLPLCFLPESAGDFIRSLPMAVIMTIIASLFVSLTIVPFLASLLMPREEHGENIVLRLMKKGIEGSYRKVLHKALEYPKTALLIALLIFGGSLALIPVVGTSVFPRSEKPQFLINIETPLGTTLQETNQAARFVENELLKHKIVKNFATNVGKSNPRIYYNTLPIGGTLSNYSQLFVQLQDHVEVPEREQFIDKLRATFDSYAGAKIRVIQFEQGAPFEAPLAVRIMGENLDSLRIISAKVEKVFKETKGTIYVNNPLSAQNVDLRVNINKDKAGMLGIPTADIDRTIRMGIAGVNLGIYKEKDGEEMNLNVSLPRNERPSMDVFSKVFVTNQMGTLVPLNQLATVGFETSPNRINHYDRERYSTVSAFIKSGFLTPEVTKEAVEKLKQVKLPKGYEIKMAGEVERSAETFGGLGTIIIITIFGIIAILILEFKTFKSTLIVLSVIPLGLIGAILILLFTGNSLSFTAIVGIIALAGIEVKNSILLVDYTNYLRKENGLSIDEAIEEAGETRFIPIVLTTMTAIGGMIPLIMEHSPLYSPLALVIVGGLISSLILTRIVTPVMYKLLPPSLK
ncbi:acriflavin resistance protein [Emticicia oligotrophica DSM 17448]|uniref:Acriflavin resistance protein n=1 Tax=Emticicia oligotrophica (strain DSM 17448 / CIP 109782 / MTCC 6937 / GPTSA100-15) TaxID=929562 RepID=A0ABM5MZI8_EMTOG|nr:efflux RND transporter permease subunit [Emticicia oligotrophica]AFK02602.1 acriflavin resistance protein [Emticicia oligotrophica DSM 17448]